MNNKRLKYVWKVVKWVKRTNSDTEYTSAIISSNFTSEFALKYEVGKETTPNIGKIFVFKTREAARKFRDTDVYSFKILKCNYTGIPVKVNYVSDRWDESDKLEYYWKYFDDVEQDPGFPFLRIAPENSFLVDSVIPIELSR